jgi:hypothetical protein
MAEVTDPLLSEGGVKAKQANYSDLMKRRVELEPRGVKVNACPFGCETHDLDDNGLCQHVVGYTNETLGMTRMEVCLPANPADRRRRRSVSGAMIEKVKPTDVKVRITTDYRVYRAGGIDELMMERETAPVNTKPAAPTA